MSERTFRCGPGREYVQAFMVAGMGEEAMFVVC